MAEQAEQTEQTEQTEQKIDPTVTVEDIGPARKRLVIEVSEQSIADRIAKNYDELSGDATIPGFRKGRAPRALIQRRFGGAVRDDVRAQLISEAYSEAIEKESIEVIGEPDVKDHDSIELPDEGSLTFEVEVEITPDVELPPLEELTVTKSDAAVTDADIDAELEQLCKRHGKMSSVESGKVKEEDFLQGDAHIHAGQDADEDAEVIAHHHDAYVYVTGKDQEHRGHIAGIVVDDLGKTLPGKNVADEISVSLTGPSSHEDDKIRDQPITIRYKINKIERMEPAKLDDLPELVGAESMDSLKDQLRKWLGDRRQREQQQEQHKQISDQLIERVDLTLPEGVTGRQTARMLQRKAMELAYRGTPEDEIERQIAEARESSEEDARRQLKLFFILSKVAKDLNVEVSAAEVNGRISLMAMEQGRRPEKVRQQLQRSGEIEYVYISIREQKTLDQIAAKAKVEEKPAAAEKAEADKPAKKTKKKTSKKKKTGDAKPDAS